MRFELHGAPEALSAALRDPIANVKLLSSHVRHEAVRTRRVLVSAGDGAQPIEEDGPEEGGAVAWAVCEASAGLRAHVTSWARRGGLSVVWELS